MSICTIAYSRTFDIDTVYQPDSTPVYVTFRMPDSFPTRINIPTHSIVFDVYTTSQTSKNYILHRTTDLQQAEIKRLTITTKNQYQEILALQKEIDRVVQKSKDLQKASSDLQDIQYSKIQNLQEQNENLLYTNLDLETQLKNALHVPWYKQIGNSGWGPFKIKYIIPAAVGYYLASQLYNR